MLDFHSTSTTASRHDDTRAVCDRLNRRILDLALALGFEPDRSSAAMDRRFGRNAHLSIAPAKSVWHDHRDGVGGDGLALVAHALGYPPKDRAGKRAAFAWARAWLGLEASTPAAPAPQQPGSPPASPPASRPAADAAAQAAVDRIVAEELQRARNRHRAQLIYDRAFPGLHTTACERYL